MSVSLTTEKEPSIVWPDCATRLNLLRADSGSTGWLNCTVIAVSIGTSDAFSGGVTHTTSGGAVVKVQAKSDCIGLPSVSVRSEMRPVYVTPPASGPLARKMKIDVFSHSPLPTTSIPDPWLSVNGCGSLVCSCSEVSGTTGRLKMIVTSVSLGSTSAAPG